MPHPPSARLFVAKLPPCVKEEEFRTHFARCGVLVDAYMPKEKTQQHYRGIGFVTYASLQEAEAVVKIQHRFQGHQVIVDFAAPKSKSSSGSLANSGACLSRKDSKVRTGKRGKEMEETVAAAKRGEIGRVEELISSSCDPVSIRKYERETSYSYFHQSFLQKQHTPLITSDIWGYSHDHSQEAGMDYPSYSNPAHTVVSDEDDTTVLDSLLREMARHTGCASSLQSGCGPETARPMSPGSASSSVPSHRSSISSDWTADQRTKPRVYVGRLHKDITANDLLLYFKQFGEVSDVYIPRSRNCRSKHRGFGFVSFASQDPIKVLISHGPHKLRGLPIILDFPIEEEYCSKNVGQVPHSK